MVELARWLPNMVLRKIIGLFELKTIPHPVLALCLQQVIRSHGKLHVFESFPYMRKDCAKRGGTWIMYCFDSVGARSHNPRYKVFKHNWVVTLTDEVLPLDYKISTSLVLTVQLRNIGVDLLNISRNSMQQGHLTYFEVILPLSLAED